MFIYFIDFIITYIYAVVGTTYFAEIPGAQFKTLGESMITLVQVGTMSSWENVLAPVSEALPMSWLYFILYIYLWIVILNLFVALLVDVVAAQRIDNEKMTKSNNKIFIFFFYHNIFKCFAYVDIETVRQSGEIGKFKNLEFSLTGSRGNEDRDDFDIGFALVNNSSSTEKLLVFERSERTKDDVVEDEDAFHTRLLWHLIRNMILRHIFKVVKSLSKL